VGLPIVVVNPRQVRDFAKALGRVAKPDALDAAILAEFAQRVSQSPRRRTSISLGCCQKSGSKNSSLSDMYSHA